MSITVDPAEDADFTLTIDARLEPTLKFLFNPLTQTNTMEIVLKYNRDGGDVAFHGYLGIPALLANDYVKLTVFGEVVVETVISAPVDPYEIEFYVYSSDVALNEVKIEFEATRAADVVANEGLEFTI